MGSIKRDIHIKVCGIKSYEQVRTLDDLPIDFVGHIFYPKSPRFLNEDIYGRAATQRQALPAKKRVGVFVNPKLDSVLEHIDTYKLDLVQLHGDETPSFCKQLKALSHCPVIKAFSIADHIDVELLEGYALATDYFLFDTASTHYGGSGQKFDWELLRSYQLKKPFFLSGGITPSDVSAIKKLSSIPGFFGVDINSGFEDAPGVKNISEVSRFAYELRTC